MGAGIIWIDGERFRYQLIRLLEIAFRVGAEAERGRQPELDGQIVQRASVIGIGSDCLVAETVTRIRFLADISAFLYASGAPENQILGVGICRRHPFETGSFDVPE